MRRCARSCSPARETLSSPAGDLRELRDRHERRTTPRCSRTPVSRVCDALESLARAGHRGPLGSGVRRRGRVGGGGATLRIARADRRRSPFKQVRMGVTTAWGAIGRLVADRSVPVGLAPSLHGARGAGRERDGVWGWLTGCASRARACRAGAGRGPSDIARGSPASRGGDEGARSARRASTSACTSGRGSSRRGPGRSTPTGGRVLLAAPAAVDEVGGGVGAAVSSLPARSC